MNPILSSELRAMGFIVHRSLTGLIPMLLRKIGIGLRRYGIPARRSKKNPTLCIDQSLELSLRRLILSQFRPHMGSTPVDTTPSSSILNLKEPLESLWEAMPLSKRTSIERLLQQGIQRNELRMPLLCPSTLTCSQSVCARCFMTLLCARRL